VALEDKVEVLDEAREKTTSLPRMSGINEEVTADNLADS
jgi:hypothetical protein